MRRLTPLILMLLTCGCTQLHYVVAVPDAVLYRTPIERETLAELPIYHHEPLLEEPTGDPIEINYKGKRGWIARNNVVLFSYRSPVYYDSGYMEDAVRSHIIDAVLGNVTWPDDVETAIREHRVVPTMNEAMVQLAWGVPHAKERLKNGAFEYRYRVYRYDRKSDIPGHYHPAPRIRYESDHPMGPGYYVEDPPNHPYFHRTHYPELRWKVVRFGKDRRVEKVTFE